MGQTAPLVQTGQKELRELLGLQVQLALPGRTDQPGRQALLGRKAFKAFKVIME
jgi:hypothetical protein